MKLRVWSAVLGTAVAATLALTSCGGGGSSPAAGGGTALEVSTDGDNLAFKETALTAPAGTDVKLTFKNASSAQQHNLVVVKGGDVAAKVDAEAMTNTPSYLPSDMSAVAAHSDLLNGGQSGTINLSLPAGTYTYICTFPGHYPAMKGTLTVQ
jgi:azurin